MRGDVLFFTPGDFIGRLIAKATHGPYCHVAVDAGQYHNIAADWSGIALRPTPPGRGVVPASLPPGADIERGFDFLVRQLGLQYGLLDVLDTGARLLLHTSFYVARPRSYDCSDLVTRYLIECGLEDWLGPLAQEPHLVTPNDLARRFSV